MASINLEVPTQIEGYVTPVPVRQFSVAEYEAIASAGILTNEDNVELLEGWISPKMTKNPPRNFILDEVYEALRARIPNGFVLKNQGVVVTTDSEPEPDLAILRGVRRDFANRHPQPDEVPLVVEVADSSLARDRYKRRIYAKAGIPTYWIVNVNERCVEVYTQPIPTDDPHYQSEDRFGPKDTVEVVLSDEITISVPVSEFLSPS